MVNLSISTKPNQKFSQKTTSFKMPLRKNSAAGIPQVFYRCPHKKKLDPVPAVDINLPVDEPKDLITFSPPLKHIQEVKKTGSRG